MKKTIFCLFTVCLLLLSGLIFGAIPEVERAALIKLYNSTNGDNWQDNSGWKTLPLADDGFAMPGTEGNWKGIEVLNSNYVITINLGSNNLSGLIPPELANLNNLEKLSLYENKITGSIPTSLGNLTKLVYLNIWGNQLNGAIPSQLFALTNLIGLDLGYNQLNGSIPTELGSLGNLQYLDFSSNQLNGSIPSQLGNLNNLRYLFLAENQLSGSIPSSFVNLQLQSLDIGHNCLSTSDTELKTWLLSHDSDWEAYQAQCSNSTTTPN